jgi:hypothetical protein
MDGGLPETAVTVDDATGEIRREDGSAVRERYVLTDGSVGLDGRKVAEDRRLNVAVYRTSGALLSTTRVSGVYPDQWSGPEVEFVQRRCRGGTLRVTLEGDPGLSAEPRTVVAVGGAERVTARVPPDELVTMFVPLRPRQGVCTVRFLVSPTVVPGPHDPRELGTHFREFDYERP